MNLLRATRLACGFLLLISSPGNASDNLCRDLVTRLQSQVIDGLVSTNEGKPEVTFDSNPLVVSDGPDQSVNIDAKPISKPIQSHYRSSRDRPEIQEPITTETAKITDLEKISEIFPARFTEGTNRQAGSSAFEMKQIVIDTSRTQPESGNRRYHGMIRLSMLSNKGHLIGLRVERRGGWERDGKLDSYDERWRSGELDAFDYDPKCYLKSDDVRARPVMTVDVCKQFYSFYPGRAIKLGEILSPRSTNKDPDICKTEGRVRPENGLVPNYIPYDAWKSMAPQIEKIKAMKQSLIDQQVEAGAIPAAESYGISSFDSVIMKDCSAQIKDVGQVQYARFFSRLAEDCSIYEPFIRAREPKLRDRESAPRSSSSNQSSQSGETAK